MINLSKENIIGGEGIEKETTVMFCFLYLQIITVTTRNVEHFVIYTEISRANGEKSGFSRWTRPSVDFGERT